MIGSSRGTALDIGIGFSPEIPVGSGCKKMKLNLKEITQCEKFVMIKFEKDRPLTKALSDVCRADKVGPAGKRFPFDLKTALAARTASVTWRGTVCAEGGPGATGSGASATMRAPEGRAPRR